jgi:formate/nitrite transporter FocA (FNT family)
MASPHALRSEPDSTRKSDMDLTPKEEQEVEERTPPRAAVVYETVRREGESEIDRPVVSLAFSGLAAGLSMGMSLAGEGMLQTVLPDAKWRPLVVAAGYTLGFVIVIMGRQQLFTENTVTAILPLLSKFSFERLMKVARLWAVVLITNLVGAGIFAYTVAHSGMFSEDVRATFASLATEAIKPGAGLIFERGVASGWLIALMVWMLPGADNVRLWIVLLVTYVVGLGAFSHVIAGSVETLYGVAIGTIGFGQYLTSFLLPVFFGNCIGGVALVSLLNYGQVFSESHDAA